MTATTVLDSRAVALSAIRGLPGGGMRQYTATTFPANPWQGCEHMLRMARACGFVTDSAHGPCDCYAVLDVLDDGGEIVQDFCITDARAFRWFRRKLDWRVES